MTNENIRTNARYEELETATGPVLHIRYEGTSRDIPLELLNLKVGSSDNDFKLAVSRYLDVAEDTLRHYVVERHSNGNLTMRPEAVFG